MFIKIVPNNVDGKFALFECKEFRYKFHVSLKEVGVRSDCRYFIYKHDDENEEPSSQAELWLYDDNKEPVQIFTRDATIYITNDKGNTVDKIYT